jgi:hypothetical protein
MTTLSNFKKLKEQVERGITGKNQGIPLSLKKAGKYLSIRQSVYTLIGGSSGTGKTGLVDMVYVLEPYMWYLENKDKTDIKIEWVYRSMERSLIQKLAKWSCYRIWREQGICITPAKLLGWTDETLTEGEKFLFDECEAFFETMQDSKIITIIEGQENPRGIWKQLHQYALERGEIEKKSEWEEIYHPNNENLIIVPVIDHAGKCKMETVDGVRGRKGTTDKLSEYMSICRDKYRMSPVVISQFNRTIKSEIFSKQEDPEPTQESFKETGNLFEDCCIALSLFNPYKFKVMNHAGYSIPDFVNKQTGANGFRGLKLLKSSYSEDDIRWGIGFMGQVGVFKDIPKASEIANMSTEKQKEFYDSIANLNYFSNDQPENSKRPFSGLGK